MVEELEELAAAISRTLGGAGVRSLAKLSGGASRESWSFQAGDQQLVFQRRVGSAGYAGIGPQTEAALLRAARSAGVPAPDPVIASDRGDELGGPYLVMQAVPGETIAGACSARIGSPPLASGS